MLATHPTSATRSNWLTDLLFLGLGLCVFYFLWINSYALFVPDEGRYSEIAREMVVSGDYITPRLDGVPFLDKPILYYWLQSSAIHLFGLKDWAMRLWPAILGIFGCLMTYATGRALFNRRTGVLAAIILGTSPLFYGAAHYANLDLEVAIFISCSLFCSVLALHNASSKQQTWLWISAYIFAGLAILTKGLIGIVFPMLIIGTWILLLQRFAILIRMHLLKGLALIACIALPWYLLVQKANPQFFHFFFVLQQFERFTTKAGFNNPSTAWFYFPVVLIGFLPWTLFLIQALPQHVKNIWRNRQTHSAELFLVLWFLIVFCFFSFPTSKTIGYILPVLPPLALLVACTIAKAWDKTKQRYVTYSSTVAAIITALALITHAHLINTKTLKPLITQVAPLIQPHDEVVSFFKYYQDLPWYLNQRITVVADWHDPSIPYFDNWQRELWFGMPYQDTHAWLIEAPEFVARWQKPDRLFVFVSKNYLPHLHALVGNAIYPVASDEHTLVVSNHPFSTQILHAVR